MSAALPDAPSNGPTPARDDDSPEWFDRVYLATDDPRAQSGFRGSAERWEAARKLIAYPIDRPGTFLDVGCANGLLMESVVRWAVFPVEPYGIDFAPANNAYTHVMTPNALSCTGAQDASGVVSNGSWGGIGAAITATSYHPGGVNVAFGDASVKFIKDSINLQTWWALGTRDGKEIISGDAY